MTVTRPAAPSTGTDEQSADHAADAPCSCTWRGYILECSDGSFYVGSTIDLERRLWQHQNGEGAEYTKRRRPVRLAWCLPFDRIDEAWAFEKHLQGWGRAKRLALIEGRADDLAGLASRSYSAIEHRKRAPPRSRDGRRAPSSTSGDTGPPPPAG